MNILLVNVPHPAIGSRIPDDHLPPLGLLAIGGAADRRRTRGLSDRRRVRPHADPRLGRTDRGSRARGVLFGHSGSTSGHPVIAAVSASVAAAMPDVHIVYGGVFPTYHAREILEAEPHVTVIVRGEGEETARRLMAALAAGQPLGTIPGLTFRDGGVIRETPPAPRSATSTPIGSAGS